MIPSLPYIHSLWDTYNLPPEKRTHVELVAIVALLLAQQLHKHAPDISINEPLLVSAALLHDIDKNISKLPGEHHPDAGVRVLREHHMDEIADLVNTHPLHCICSSRTAPKTWEEKLLFLADKMVKYKIITVDERFTLWRNEELSHEAKQILEESYPLVKQLEQEVFSLINAQPNKIMQFAGRSILKRRIATMLKEEQ